MNQMWHCNVHFTLSSSTCLLPNTRQVTHSCLLPSDLVCVRCRNHMFLSYPDRRHLLSLHSAWQNKSSSSPGFPSCCCIAGTRCSPILLRDGHCTVLGPSLVTTSSTAHNKCAASSESLSSSWYIFSQALKVLWLSPQRGAKAAKYESRMRGKKANQIYSNKNEHKYNGKI